MVYDEESEINDTVQYIIDIQKKHIEGDIDITKIIWGQITKQHTSAKKHDVAKITKFSQEISELFNKFGERKWRTDKVRQIVSDGSKSIGIDSNQLYDTLMDSLYDRYFSTDPVIIKILREKLQILSSLLQGEKLRDALKICFRPKKTVATETIGFLLSRILDDEFIYSKEKIAPTCEHVIPKKLYNNAMPYNADMHSIHLAINELNSLRDRKKFAYVPNGKKIHGNLYNDEWFEPETRSKGVVARACAYFFTCYPEHIGVITDTIDIDCLREWGVMKPDLAEHERDLFVYQLQNTLNPYIVYPRLIHHAFCDLTEKSVQLAKTEKSLEISCNKLQNELFELEQLINAYVELTTEHSKAGYGLIILDRLKKEFNKIDKFWD